MVHEKTRFGAAALGKSSEATLFERNTMLKTLKRKIALVAASALGATGLAVVIAPAAFAADPAITTSHTTIRSDDTTFAINPANLGGLAAGVVTVEEADVNNSLNAAAVKVTYKSTAASTEVALTTDVDNIAAAGATKYDTVASYVRFGVDPGADQTYAGTLADGWLTIAAALGTGADGKVLLEVGRGALPGIYTMYFDPDGTGAAVKTVVSKSITVANAPTTVKIFAAGSTTTSSATLTGNGAKNYDLSVTDGSRNSYLLGAERVDLSVSGGSGSGVTVTTPALASIGAGSLLSTTTSQNVTVTLTAATASGTYTVTGTPVGFTGTSATGTLVAVSTANVKAATKLEFTTTPATGTTGAVADVDSDSVAGGASANLAAAQGVAGASNFIPTSARSLTFKATFAAGTTGDAAFTVAGSTITGITTGTVNLVTIGADATASITYTATNANAAEAIWVTVDAVAGGGGNVLELTSTYENASVAKVTIDPDTTSLAAKTGSVVTLKAKVTNQFGIVIAGNPTTLTTNGAQRNASKTLTELTDASGIATFSYTDASTSTTNLTDAITITASAVGPITDTITVTFGADTTPATVTLAANQPGTPNTTQTYDTVITAVAARSVTVDTLLGNADEELDGTADEQIKDQVLLTATVKNAATTNVTGVPVVWTGSDGVWFIAGNVVANVPNTATLAGVKTVTTYTNAGLAYAQASFTKAGTATITAKAGDVTATWTITVKAASNGIISATASGPVVTATVTDLFGNPVAGTTVSFTAATGATLGAGTSSISGVTNADGVVTAVVSAVTAGDYVVTVAHSTGDTAVAADTTNGMPAGVASATATAKVAGATAVNAATETAINAVKTDVKAVSDTVATLSKAVTVVQSSVSELTATFTSQIKVLTDAIAKISRAIAALQKSLKKK